MSLVVEPHTRGKKIKVHGHGYIFARQDQRSAWQMNFHVLLWSYEDESCWEILLIVQRRNLRRSTTSVDSFLVSMQLIEHQRLIGMGKVQFFSAVASENLTIVLYSLDLIQRRQQHNQPKMLCLSLALEEWSFISCKVLSDTLLLESLRR